jgi:hypothetical protein
MRWWSEVVELPEAALTGSHGSGRVRMRNQNLGFPDLFLGVLNGNDVFHYFSPFFFNLFLLFLIFFHTTFSTSNNTWMRNRKLRNIHPSGAF